MLRILRTARQNAIEKLFPLPDSPESVFSHFQSRERSKRKRENRCIMSFMTIHSLRECRKMHAHYTENLKINTRTRKVARMYFQVTQLDNDYNNDDQ